jgi:hypothetical protein
MPVPVELLRFFDKFAPTQAPAGGEGSQGSSLADFGGDDVAQEEAAIESGAPLEIPDVPSIPELPQETADGHSAAAVDGLGSAATADVSKQEVPVQAPPEAP